MNQNLRNTLAVKAKQSSKSEISKRSEREEKTRLTKAGLKQENSTNTCDVFETLRQCEERKTERE